MIRLWINEPSLSLMSHQCDYPMVKVHGTVQRGRSIHGLYKPIHGKCAIYFYPGIRGCEPFFCPLIKPYFIAEELAAFRYGVRGNLQGPKNAVWCLFFFSGCVKNAHGFPPAEKLGLLKFIVSYRWPFFVGCLICLGEFGNMSPLSPVQGIVVTYLLGS